LLAQETDFILQSPPELSTLTFKNDFYVLTAFMCDVLVALILKKARVNPFDSFFGFFQEIGF